MPDHSPLDDPISTEAAERSRKRVRRHTERRRRRKAQRLVWAIAAVAATAAVFAHGEPTGLAVADVAYRAAFAAGLTVAAARARRWTWFVVAGAAGAVGSDDPVPLTLAACSLAVSFGSLAYGRRQRELGAVVGAIAAQALLRLPTDLAFGVPSLTAALAATPLVVSALANTAGTRRLRLPALALVLVLAAIGGAFVHGMLSAEGHARDGVAAARRGLAAAGDGEDPASAAAFAEASAELGAAREIAASWWLAPARAIPVLGQHVRVVDDVAREGQALAALSSEQAATLDVSGLSKPEGGLDIARIRALTPTATTVVAALERAQRVIDDARTPWLVPPVADRVGEFADEIDEILPVARNASDALQIAPQLLGAERPQTYLVLVGNPAESRELGGFVASVGYLRADRGDLDFTSAGSVTSANRAVAASGLQLEGTFPAPLPSSDPVRYVQNWTNSVDFTATANVAAQLGPAITDSPVDGVLYIDPYALALLLEVTGPVPIEGREPLAARDAVDYLLRDQYLAAEFEDDGERKDRLRDAAEAAFDELTSSSLPDPRRLADLLSPAARARRLLFTTFDETHHQLLERVGLRPPKDLGADDQLLVAQENLRANKLDAYLSRAIRYDLDIDAAGNADGTVTVELTNSAPAEGLDPYVTGDGARDRSDTLPDSLHRIGLDLHSRLEVVEVTVDGDATGSAILEQGDLFRTNTRVDIPAGSTVTVVFHVRGAMPTDSYDLAVIPNGVAGTDTFTAVINRASRRTSVESTPLDHVLTVDDPA
ncbi:DUF4012 domain-containing protein [Actinospongicola halichondriae]|uniref:DUF4012 domain-containing protein n=1 Tax=Actinospongicola halichondriae TaxID=3236844 RepID=UPI003D3EFEA9